MVDDATPQIIVAGDDLLRLEEIAGAIANGGRLAVTATTDLDGAIVAVRHLHPDAVVLDMSTVGSLKKVQRLNSAEAGVPLIGFEMAESAVDVIGAAEAGLAGFVDQHGTVDEIVKTVIDAINGEVVCSPKAAAMLHARLAGLEKGHSKQSSRLTPSERQIAEMVAEGRSNEEISQSLHIGLNEVKNQVHSILLKLNLERLNRIARAGGWWTH